MKNLFLKDSNGRVLRVKSFCMSRACLEKEMPELFLEDMNGYYAGCIEASDLFSGEWILSNDYYRLVKSD